MSPQAWSTEECLNLPVERTIERADYFEHQSYGNNRRDIPSDTDRSTIACLGMRI